MDWIKRNLFFVIGATVAVVLLAGASYYNYSKWKLNAEEREKLNQSYEESKRLNNLNPHPGKGKVDNIKLAREQQKEQREFLNKKVGRFFQRIPAIPDSTSVGSAEFSSALRLTIDQLQREATNSSVMVPPNYAYSFSRQRELVKFAGGLDALAVQLGEVRAIARVLDAAKINSLDSLRRERVSADDQSGPLTDYIDIPSQTNELAVLTPYEIVFRGFSPELAAVLEGFANSPHCLIVKSLNVEVAPAAVMDAATMPFAVMPMPVAPVAVAPPPGSYGARPPIYGEEGGDAFRQRYGRGYPPQAPTPAPTYAMPAPVARTGPKVFLNEKQLRVTLLVYVVKMFPRKA